MGLHPLPARDAPRVRRRRGRPVRAPLRELAAGPEGRAVGLLLRRRHRRALQRERFAGHAGGRRRLRALRAIAPGPRSRQDPRPQAMVNRRRTAAKPRTGGYAASANTPTASGSHCRQAAGIVGLATWMKTCGLGALGVRRGCMPALSGRWSPLRRLQGAHDATMLSQLELPPFERGMTWSTVRFEREPQYWHVQPSRAKTARRVILRRCVSRGTLTYETSRMTTGRGIAVCSERSSHVACSSSSAFAFRRRIAARRTEQTLIGSKVALRTSTRPASRPRGRCPMTGADDTGPGGV